jgi:hypothetical protein
MFFLKIFSWLTPSWHPQLSLSIIISWWSFLACLTSSAHPSHSLRLCPVRGFSALESSLLSFFIIYFNESPMRAKTLPVFCITVSPELAMLTHEGINDCLGCNHSSHMETIWYIHVIQFSSQKKSSNLDSKGHSPYASWLCMKMLLPS